MYRCALRLTYKKKNVARPIIRIDYFGARRRRRRRHNGGCGGWLRSVAARRKGHGMRVKTPDGKNFCRISRTVCVRKPYKKKKKNEITFPDGRVVLKKRRRAHRYDLIFLKKLTIVSFRLFGEFRLVHVFFSFRHDYG